MDTSERETYRYSESEHPGRRAASELDQRFAIYGFRLAGSAEYRYVGQTSQSVLTRLYFHKIAARKVKPKLPVHLWLKKHAHDDVMVDVLSRLPFGADDEMNEQEIAFISQFRGQGHRLLNLTDGGGGSRGYVPGPRTREFMSKRMSGEGNPMFGVHRMGELAPSFGLVGELSGNFGKRGSKASAFGFKHTDEERQRMSARNSGSGNPMFGRTGALAPGFGRIGELNPAFGRPSMFRGVTGTDHPGFGIKRSDDTKWTMRIAAHERRHIQEQIISFDCVFCNTPSPEWNKPDHSPVQLAAHFQKIEAERAALKINSDRGRHQSRHIARGIVGRRCVLCKPELAGLPPRARADGADVASKATQVAAVIGSYKICSPSPAVTDSWLQALTSYASGAMGIESLTSVALLE